MKVAIPQWMGRVSPVLDVANRLVICERTERGDIIREDILLTDNDPYTRAETLRALGITEVICGTLSRGLQRALQAAGIEIYPHVRGDIEQVVDACLNGSIASDDFRMPGCGHGRRQGMRHRRGRHR
ncbi:hypothetical protein KQI52_09415 [bacterium]|nr:hypothetical protein [bacterium]